MVFSLVNAKPWLEYREPVYTTMDDVKKAVTMGMDIVEKDASIRSAIVEATGIIRNHTRRDFLPYIRTKTFKWQDHYWLKTYRDYTEILNVTNGSRDLTNDVRNAPVNAFDKQKPYRDLWIPQDGFIYTFDYQTSGIKDNAIEVTARWGNFHYESTSMVTVGTAMTGTESDLNLITNLDTTGYFSEGMMLRIDDEYLQVVDIDGATVSVLRAFAGTTAATHAAGSDIKIISPIASCRSAATILAARILARRDGAYSDVSGILGDQFLFIKQLPAEVKSFVVQEREKEFMNLDYITTSVT